MILSGCQDTCIRILPAVSRAEQNSGILKQCGQFGLHPRYFPKVTDTFSGLRQNTVLRPDSYLWNITALCDFPPPVSWFDNDSRFAHRLFFLISRPLRKGKLRSAFSCRAQKYASLGNRNREIGPGGA